MAHDILLVIIGIVIGIAIGIFLSRFLVKKELEDNPPINEQVIAQLMTSMGRKPNSKQINQVMQQMRKYNNTGSKKKK